MKVVALCSGGFDSVVLMHFLRDLFELDKYSGDEIYTLFFDYGQRNAVQERACSQKVSEKVGVKEWKELKLPPFDWTKFGFYSPTCSRGGSSNYYLEYRNLVFLSYAFSYAQSISAEEIYTGFLRSFDGDYPDANEYFLSVLNQLDSNIKVVAPFIHMTKPSIIPLAKSYDLTSDDFFSCGYPDEQGNPCGKCMDCANTSEILKLLQK